MGNRTQANSPMRRQIGWGLLAAAGVGLAATWLTVARGLPFGADSKYHLYRLVESHYLNQHGLIFSRWSPYLGFGYGFPMFNFHPRLLFYLAELFLLAGLGPIQALQVSLGVVIIAGALGTYFWVEDLFGPGPGLVAATAFLFSPYVMYTLLVRAGFPEILALAWMPWGLWALFRYVTRRSLVYGLAAAAILAAILLSHLFSAYLFIATSLLYVTGLGLTSFSPQHKPDRLRLLSLLGLSWPLGLGLGLAAFFWLPAMGEANLIQIKRLLTLGDPGAGQGLVPLWQVFVGPVLPKASTPGTAASPRLSWFAIGLGLVGAVSGWVALRSRALKLTLLVGSVVILLAVFMLTPASRWLWSTLPLLHLIHFPIRFLGVASLWLALLAGAGAGSLLALLPAGETLDRRRMPGIWRGLTAVVLVAGLSLALALYAVDWPAVTYHPPNVTNDLAVAMRFERESGAMGFMARSEYLPKTVAKHPPAESGPGVGQGRLVVESLPVGARLVTAQYDLLDYSITIDSPQPFQAIVNTFYFPGWWAEINGQRVPIIPTEPYGLISLNVPAGQQHIEVGFGSTPIRDGATGLSLVSALCLAALLAKAATASLLNRGRLPWIAGARRPLPLLCAGWISKGGER